MNAKSIASTGQIITTDFPNQMLDIPHAMKMFEYEPLASQRSSVVINFALLEMILPDDSSAMHERRCQVK